MSTLPARRLPTACIALVAVATLVYITVPATRPALWAVIGLAGVTAVLVGTRLHHPAHRWPWWVPAGGLLTCITGDTCYDAGFDIAYGIPQLNDLWRTGTLLGTGGTVFCTAWGLAAPHPSMVELTAAVPQGESLVVLTMATLIAPGILLYQGLSDETRDATVIAVFSGALFLLVILRLTGMVVAHRRAVPRELALLGAAASLVSAFRQEGVDRSCRTAVDRLLGPDVPHRTLLPTDSNPDLGAHGTRLMSPVALEPGIAAVLDGPPSVLVCPMTQPDRPAGADPGVLLAAAPERLLAETSGSLGVDGTLTRLSERFPLRLKG
ncbi:hypothetical protein [Streptomyces sp. CA-179760]|uniref:hypothetical protein n=1 Tax=Streptomyces sp. CA-179760 TaxID=3240054 RepID=UPI003D8B195C